MLPLSSVLGVFFYLPLVSFFGVQTICFYVPVLFLSNCDLLALSNHPVLPPSSSSLCRPAVLDDLNQLLPMFPFFQSGGSGDAEMSSVTYTSLKAKPFLCFVLTQTHTHIHTHSHPQQTTTTTTQPTTNNHACLLFHCLYCRGCLCRLFRYCSPPGK